MTDDQLNADVEGYLQAVAMNTAPPLIASDPVVSGVTPIEQLLAVLGLAANIGDEADAAASAEQHAEREAKTGDAAGKFGAYDQQAAEELNAVAAVPDQAAAMAAQLPQLASGIAGAVAGAVSGALQPLVQLPQQVGQGLQQAVQAGAQVVRQAAESAVAPAEDTDPGGVPPPGDFGGGPDADTIGDQWRGPGAGDGGTGPGITAPTAFLGPPPVPSASTAPSSAPPIPITPSGTAATAATGTAGMAGIPAGMPVVPPGAMAGAGADKDAKAGTKRVSAPPVRNGAPVQGRLIPPSLLPPVSTKTEAKPVVTRRISAPKSAGGDPSGEAGQDC